MSCNKQQKAKQCHWIQVQRACSVHHLISVHAFDMYMPHVYSIGLYQVRTLGQAALSGIALLPRDGNMCGFTVIPSSVEAFSILHMVTPRL